MKHSLTYILIFGAAVVLGVVVWRLISNDQASGSQPTNAPTNSAPTTSIQDISWQWVSVTEQSSGTKTNVPNPKDYLIAFYTDGTLSGKADCNTFEGSYSQQNGFSIHLGATTQMYCGENSMDQQYLTLLANVAAGGPDGIGGLALETAGGANRILFKNGGKASKP